MQYLTDLGSLCLTPFTNPSLLFLSRVTFWCHIVLGVFWHKLIVCTPNLLIEISNLEKTSQATKSPTKVQNDSFFLVTAHRAKSHTSHFPPAYLLLHYKDYMLQTISTDHLLQQRHLWNSPGVRNPATRSATQTFHLIALSFSVLITKHKRNAHAVRYLRLQRLHSHLALRHR